MVRPLKNSITLNDLAKALTITPATVSRARGNHPEISIKIRQHYPVIINTS